MVDTQVYDEFPDDLAFTVGMWDYATAILAVITAFALRNKWKYVIALTWVFNIFGFTDLIVAFPQVFEIEFYNYDLGTMWWAFTTIRVVNMISHFYIFRSPDQKLEKEITNIRKEKLQLTMDLKNSGSGVT